MKKINKYVLLLLCPILIILNIYYSIPARIIVTQNSEYSLKLNYPCFINEKNDVKSVSVSDEPILKKENKRLVLNTSSCGKYDLSVKIFNKIPIKTISVTVAPAKYVVPSGDAIGIKLYTRGLLVVSISEFAAEDGRSVSPGREAGLRTGDRIIAANGSEISSSEEFAEGVKKSSGDVNITVMRENRELELTLVPRVSADEHTKKLGIWVRDSTAGIGTLTYYDPMSELFAALGHAICDTDTGEIMTVKRGTVWTCRIMSVERGRAGEPGELIGSFSDTAIGNISDNNELGIYGNIYNYSKTSFAEAVGVATRFQIKEGEAYILANVDGEGVKKYVVRIMKVSKSAAVDNKGLIIKVTDPELIEKTGGIVQGMSGAPIIQNNMLIGAVTHVFVNDPTRGYGIFAENLLNITNNIQKN